MFENKICQRFALFMFVSWLSSRTLAHTHAHSTFYGKYYLFFSQLCVFVCDRVYICRCLFSIFPYQMRVRTKQENIHIQELNKKKKKEKNIDKETDNRRTNTHSNN